MLCWALPKRTKPAVPFNRQNTILEAEQAYNLLSALNSSWVAMRFQDDRPSEKTLNGPRNERQGHLSAILAYIFIQLDQIICQIIFRNQRLTVLYISYNNRLTSGYQPVHLYTMPSGLKVI